MDRYPEYRDSGIEWIGTIPKHWEARKAKYLFKQIQSQITTDELANSEVIYYSIPNVQEFGIGKLESGGDIKSNKLIIRQNLLLISRLNPRKATICIAKPHKYLTICSTEFVPYTKRVEKVSIKYYFYTYISSNLVELLDSMVESVTKSHQRISPDRLNNIYVCLPTYDEQILIANYLDKKTTQIDSLIEKLEKKILLLKQYRVALISQCATKGLNPKVKMKDSDIEWIGKIPTNWNMIKLKYVTDSNDNVLSETTDPEYSFTYIQIGDVDYIEGITLNEPISFRESPSRARRIAKPGDVIISTVRTYLKAIGTIPNVGDIICSTGFCVITGKKGTIEQEFLAYSVTSEWFISFVICNSDGVSYPAINVPELVDLKIALPGAEEQRQIAQFLSKKTFQIDSLIKKHTKKIELLKDYRQSLIFNVVTGKIRVAEHLP